MNLSLCCSTRPRELASSLFCSVVLEQVQKKQFRGYFVFVSVASRVAAAAYPDIRTHTTNERL